MSNIYPKQPKCPTCGRGEAATLCTDAFHVASMLDTPNTSQAQLQSHIDELKAMLARTTNSLESAIAWTFSGSDGPVKLVAEARALLESLK